MTSQMWADSPRQHLDPDQRRSDPPSVRAVPAVIRLLVVIANQLFRESITCALGDLPEVEVVGALPDVAPAESHLALARPTVAVIGPFGPGRMNVAEARPMTLAAPSCRFVFIVERPNWATMRQALDAGAFGVVPLTASLAQLVTAVRGAASGYLAVDPDALEPTDPVAGTLTERELAILRLTARGLPSKEIAHQLFLSPGTVRNNTSTLIKKLGGRNRHEAVRLAAEQGLL